MQYKIGKSQLKDTRLAVAEATKGLVAPKLILFSSHVEPFETYSQLLKEQFPQSMIVGSTSYIALSHLGASKETLLVLGIEEGIACYGDVLEEIDRYPLKYVSRVEKALNHFSDLKNVVCFQMTTGLTSSEELVITTLNSVLEPHKVPLFGGTAGDAGNATKTMVSLNGKVYHETCVFVMIKNLKGKVKFYRENIYKKYSTYHIATKVDVKNRIVYEYDHQPATTVMAKELGIKETQLPQYLNQYPWGRLIGDEMYITANQHITKDKGISYYARVYKNAQMVLLEPDDYRKVMRNTFLEVKREIPNPSLTIMIHCFARSVLFEQENYLDEFTQVTSASLGSFIGFSGYGEQLKKQHFNQTMLIAVFE